MAKVSRKDVYEAIDSERDYQDRLSADRTDGREHAVGEYLTMLRHYLNKADEAWTMNAGDLAALEQMRKIAGIAVRCMEDWGAPKRDLEPPHEHKCSCR